jgi:hypothetical protein
LVAWIIRRGGHSVPQGYQPQAQPDTDYSVVKVGEFDLA